MKRAEKFKEEANVCFKEKRFNKAIELYTQAISCDSSNPVYYSNRSFAYFNLDFFGSALNDASKAIELDPSYLKGLYRRAAAYMALSKYKLALKDYEAINKVEPNNSDSQKKYKECLKLTKKSAFEKAISIKGKKSDLFESFDIDSYEIESGYTGPRLENNKVTLEFVQELLECYRNQGKLHKRYAYRILVDVKKHFDDLPSLVDVNIGENDNFTICGDIHGQFYDLLNIFKLNGFPSETNPYLFNGDFVDRGSFSVECIFTLFSFKLLYPERFYMSRGNHESQTMNLMYGFEGEVKAKYSEKMVDMFTEVYNCLPLAHCLNGRVLVMHGGLFSKDDVTLNDIKSIDRKRQPPDEGLMCDILWSDPQDASGRCPSKRGVGIQFGPDVTESFTKLNNLDYIIRSHEVKSEGYEIGHGGKCITVFSAPNYVDTMQNKGAFINMNGKDLKPNFTTFDAVPHPQVKPMVYANSLFGLLNIN